MAKQPDVWGQARLTAHRQDVENVLYTYLNKFQDSLQGSLSRSDQAYLADAFALSAAVSSGTAGAAPPPRVAVSNTTANTVAETPIPVPAATPQTDVFAGFNSISRTPVQGPLNIPFAVAKTGLSLEPTEVLDQLNRYLQHLNELRRTNEGDDTADSPGYSLNLVRVPVSVLPGKKTYQGYGAEVTMTLTPYLSDELLPTTFRNLVLNDLVDQIGVPLTQLLNNDPCFVKDWLDEDQYDVLLARDKAEAGMRSAGPNFMMPVAPAVSAQAEPIAGPNPQPATPTGPSQQQPPPFHRGAADTNALIMQNTRSILSDMLQQKGITDPADTERKLHLAAVPSPLPSVPSLAIPATKVRRAKLPFPPSQFLDIYGYAFAYRIAYDAHQALAADVANRPVVHLPDVQGYLQEEVADANLFLADPKNADLWVKYCTPDLVTAIRAWPAYVTPGAILGRTDKGNGGLAGRRRRRPCGVRRGAQGG